jgi:AcrR family transcriptional regulator
VPPPPVSTSKRQHIVETAYALFKRVGYHATGIDRIIAESNVAKMTMYRNFPSKDGLIVEVLEYRAKRFEAQLDRLAETVATPELKIGTILDWYERWFQSPDFHGCLFAHALAEFSDPGHPVFEAVAKQKNGFRQRLRRILDETMPGDRAESVSAALFMLLEGATLLAQMGHGEEAIRNIRKVAPSLIAMPAKIQ